MCGLNEVVKKTVCLLATTLFIGVGLSAGCDGCRGSSEDRTEEQELATDEAMSEVPLRDRVIAVGRIKELTLSHYDHRAWRREAIEAERIVTGEGGLSAGLPTARFRTLLERVLDNYGGHVHWDGHLDVVVWEAEEEGEAIRWAAAIPWARTEPLEDEVEWTQAGRYATGDEAGAEVRTVFERVDGEQTYFVSTLPTAPSRGSGFRGESVTISNFAEGAVRVAEAVAETGASGARDAELYLWPRRSGIARRYLEAAELMEQRMATSGHDLLPARVGLLQLQGQIYRALGNPEAWPKIARLSLEADRAGEERQARRVTVTLDVTADQGVMLPALWHTLRETNLQAGPPVNDPETLLQLTFRPRELSALATATIPEPWLQLLSIRSAGTRQLLMDDFHEVLLHHRGPTTVAFYSGPRALTGEFFVGFRAMDFEDLNPTVHRFHHRFLRDFWMPLFDVSGLPSDEQRTEVFAGEETEIYELSFPLPHGGQAAGVCWTTHGRFYLSYYGVNPCERLREVAEIEADPSAGAAIAFEGSVAGLLETLYVLPGDQMQALFEGVELRFWGKRLGRQRIEMNTTITDLGDLAVYLEDIPKLQAYWDSAAALDPSQLALELSLQQTTYQEPGLALLGVPGVGGVLPPSFLLGLPFSFGPTPPTLFRSVYFGSGDEAQSP